MRHKILHCSVDKLTEMLDSDEVVGWRVLAILPNWYVHEPMVGGYLEVTPPPGWEAGPNEKLVEKQPSIFLTHVVIVLES